LASATDFKNFIQGMCCESYPDIAKHSQELRRVEAEWPCYKETKQGATGETAVTWGDTRLGRIPAFIREDIRPLWTAGADSLAADAEIYTKKYNDSLQQYLEEVLVALLAHNMMYTNSSVWFIATPE